MNQKINSVLTLLKKQLADRNVSVEERQDQLFFENCVILPAWPESFEALCKLMDTMKQLTKTRPESLVLISNRNVYGVSFGAQHPLKEEELGYLCHMRETDQIFSNMRIAEHFACALAREEGLPVRIVRMDTEEGADMKLQAEEILKVLSCGEAGAVYNLSSGKSYGATSPLTPNEIVMDTQKLERLK